MAKLTLVGIKRFKNKKGFSMAKESYKERMEKTINSLQNDLKGIRTGRANASILDGIKVEAYGSNMPLKQVGNVTTPDAKTIMIQPFDKALIGDIEKAILKSDLGFNPFNESGNIRIVVPELTKERREELKKGVRHRGEEAKISIRNIRRDENDKIKKELKDKTITEDESKNQEKKIQTDTDSYIKKVDELIGSKEKELDTI